MRRGLPVLVAVLMLAGCGSSPKKASEAPPATAAGVTSSASSEAARAGFHVVYELG